MPKFIFILFLFFCSLQAFSQKRLPNCKHNNTEFRGKAAKIAKKQAKILLIKDLKETDYELLLKDNNLCEILSIKVSDLLNESMLKKLKANV